MSKHRTKKMIGPRDGPRQKIVGVYPLGQDYCEIVLREGDGDEFYVFPEKGKVPRIKVGVDNNWESFLTVLYHEAMEFLLVRRGHRWRPGWELSVANAAEYLFVLDHQQMHHVAEGLGVFTSQALADVRKAYREWHK